MTTFVQLCEHDIAYDLVNVLDRLTGKSTSEQQVLASQREREILQQHAERQARIEAGEEVEGEDETLPPIEEKQGLAALVAEGNINSLLETGLLSQLDPVMTTASDIDIETVFTLTFALFHRLDKDKQQVNKIVARILPPLTQTQTQNSNNTPLTRLRILTQLFNLLNATLPTSQVLPGLPQTQVATALTDVGVELVSTVLSALFRYVLATEQSAEAVNSLPVLLAIIHSWELKPLPLADFLLQAYEITKQTQSQNSLVEEYLYKYLRSLDAVAHDSSPAAVAALRAARPHAVNAAHRAITSPLSLAAAPIFHSTASASSPLTPHRLLSLAAIAQLAHTDNPDEAHIYTLLKIFATDDVDAYLTFYQQSEPWLRAHGYQHEINLKKLRILSLCALASQGYERLSYAQIGEQLTLKDETDIENAIIDAIISGRLEAKIDGEKQQIIIKRVVGSILKPVLQATNTATAPKPTTAAGMTAVSPATVQMVADWASLEKRLNGWKNNIQTVLTKLNREQGNEEYATEDV